MPEARLFEELSDILVTKIYIILFTLLLRQNVQKMKQIFVCSTERRAVYVMATPVATPATTPATTPVATPATTLATTSADATTGTLARAAFAAFEQILGDFPLRLVGAEPRDEAFENAVTLASAAIKACFATSEYQHRAELYLKLVDRVACQPKAVLVAAVRSDLWGEQAATLLVLLTAGQPEGFGGEAAQNLFARAASSAKGLEAVRQSLKALPRDDGAAAFYAAPSYATPRALRAAGVVAAASRSIEAISAYHAFVGRIRVEPVVENGPLVAAYMAGALDNVSLEKSPSMLEDVAAVFDKLGTAAYTRPANGLWLKALPAVPVSA